MDVNTLMATPWWLYPNRAAGDPRPMPADAGDATASVSLKRKMFDYTGPGEYAVPGPLRR